MWNFLSLDEFNFWMLFLPTKENATVSYSQCLSLIMCRDDQFFSLQILNVLWFLRHAKQFIKLGQPCLSPPPHYWGTDFDFWKCCRSHFFHSSLLLPQLNISLHPKVWHKSLLLPVLCILNIPSSQHGTTTEIMKCLTWSPGNLPSVFLKICRQSKKKCRVGWFYPIYSR